MARKPPITRNVAAHDVAATPSAVKLIARLAATT
jgi:hypothetical protein